MRILLYLTFFCALSLTSHSQSKFQYLTIDFDYSINDSIRYSIDISGVETNLIAPIAPIVNKELRYKTANELLNSLGKQGWEVYFIEDFPNTIQQKMDRYSGRPINGSYSLYRNSQFSKRKVYLKIKYD